MCQPVPVVDTEGPGLAFWGHLLCKVVYSASRDSNSSCIETVREKEEEEEGLPLPGRVRRAMTEER